MPATELESWNKYFAVEPPPHEAILIGFYKLARIIESFMGNKNLPTFNEFYPFWEPEQDTPKDYRRAGREAFVALKNFYGRKDG